MKPLSVNSIGIGLAAVTVTCLIGFAATYVCDRLYVRFEKVAMGSIAMGTNGRGGFSSYRASDGVNVSFVRLDFPSAEEATKAFENVLGASNKIIAREFVRDRETHVVVGERLVALFPADDEESGP